MKMKFKFSADAWETNKRRLTNQIYKLLPMYEAQEDWQKQQHTLILELHGYNDLFFQQTSFMVLIAKLYALDHVEAQADFRKLVFEALSELSKLNPIGI